MKIMNTTTFLTRKCNLNCGYCKIKDNNFKGELSIDEWKKAFSILKDVGINIIMGGEPCSVHKLPELIKHMEKEKIRYALATNGTLWRKDLIDAGLSNWSVSYDGIVKDEEVNRKTQQGVVSLEKAKESGIKDLHATITVTKENISQIPNMIKDLSSRGIWSEITALHWKKNEHYDFAGTPQSMKNLIVDWVPWHMMEKLWDMKRAGYKIHNEEEYFIDYLKYVYKLNWKCGDYPYSLSIDADGKLRTCLHIAGSKKFSIFDLPEKWDDFVEQWKKDKEKMCEGCFWDCFWQAEYWAKKGFEEGKRRFRHE